VALLLGLLAKTAPEARLGLRGTACCKRPYGAGRCGLLADAARAATVTVTPETFGRRGIR
jgi:hypothetical protein